MTRSTRSEDIFRYLLIYPVLLVFFVGAIWISYNGVSKALLTGCTDFLSRSGLVGLCFAEAPVIFSLWLFMYVIVLGGFIYVGAFLAWSAIFGKKSKDNSPK